MRNKFEFESNKRTTPKSLDAQTQLSRSAFLLWGSCNPGWAHHRLPQRWWVRQKSTSKQCPCVLHCWFFFNLSCLIWSYRSMTPHCPIILFIQRKKTTYATWMQRNLSMYSIDPGNRLLLSKVRWSAAFEMAYILIISTTYLAKLIPTLQRDRNVLFGSLLTLSQNNVPFDVVVFMGTLIWLFCII